MIRVAVIFSVKGVAAIFSTKRVAVIFQCCRSGAAFFCWESQYLVSDIGLNRGLKEWGEERFRN